MSALHAAGSDSVRAVNAPLARRLQLLLLSAAGALFLSACGSSDERSANQLGYTSGAFPAGEGISTLETVAIYVLAPLALLLVLAAIVWLPGVVRSSRYRPGKGWAANPLWFGGPPDPAAAVESADAGDTVRGGASGSW